MFQRQAREPFPFRNILFIAAIVAACLYWLIKSLQAPAEPPTPPKTEREPGVPPNEAYFSAREYPRFAPDMEAWSDALRIATETAAERGPSGSLDAAWTVQGPGNIGARVNTIKVHPTNPNIIYIGYANGGVWKTTNGGQSWFPVFDDQPLLVIGDIELDPQNPEIVYVATGDPNVGGYVSIGDGLWKSTNGGQTWQHLGLENTRIISKIIIHPQNSNIIYAATMGLPFQRNNERGVYKTTNGGQTWQQVLFIDNQTGCSDIEMSSTDPNVLYASTWVRIRTNSESLVSGVNSGIWKTTNGGQTWTRQSGGLPTDRKSRVSIAIDPVEPNRVLAMYADSTLELHNIYETLDGGISWTPTPNAGLDYGFQAGFAWYFGCLEINPFFTDDVWAGGVEMWRSFDRGANWGPATPSWWLYEVHADMHDLAFVSDNVILLATDGGLYRSDDNGFTWAKTENITTTQFYRVAFNPHEPSWYYGGAQDNGTTGGNLNDINNWPRLGGGDGFQPAFHPTDPNIYYFESQNGSIYGTNDGQGFIGATDGIPGDDRRSWDMPFFISRQESEFMFTGTYRVYQGVGHIPVWSAVSPDLTDGVIFGNNYHVISAIDEDYFAQGVVYAGTSDANVWRGNTATQEWTNITAGLPERYVSSVHPSPLVPNRVFVTQTGYRVNDFSAHIHRSDNNGQTWTPIAGDLPPVSVNDLQVIPNRGDSVLVAATDLGVYVTLNGGVNWQRLGTGLPLVRVFDLDINPVQKTLIAGTHARSIMTFPLDSLKMEDEISGNTNVATTNNCTIYPTVVQSGATLSINVPDSPSSQQCTFALYSLDGKCLLSQPLSRNGQVPVPTNARGTCIATVHLGGRLLKAQKIAVLR